MANSPLDNTDGPVGVAVRVGGKDIPDDAQVQSVRVTKALNRIPEAVVTFISDAAQLEDFEQLDSDDFALGSEVEIAAYYGANDEQTLFSGIIVTTRLRADGSKGVRMEVICRDKALKMTGVRSSIAYLEQKDKDVMTSIVEAAGLTADIAATTATVQLNLRVGATDWDFLRLLADRNGQVLVVDGGKVTSLEVDTSGTEVLTLIFGEDVVALDIQIDAQPMVASASTSAWNAQTQKKLTGEDETLETETLGTAAIKDVAAVLGNRAFVAATARDIPEADLSGFSKARMTRAALATVHGTAKFQGNGTIALTDMIEITYVGKRFGGKGYVSEITHDIAGGVWSTTTRLGLPAEWRSDSFDLAAAGAEALATPIYGPQIGKVMAVAEDPEGQQRIQVSLPMIGDPAVEIWARHATPYASAEAGFQFLPEVDDEVVVAFLNADPNAPVIIGSLHNDVAARPEAASADNFIKTIVTPTAMKLSFDDEKQVITVETPGGHKLTLDDDAASVSMVDSNGNSLVMDSSGIALSSGADISLTATGKITAQATGDASLTGSNVTVEGQIGFTGKGGATAELSAGGTTDVKGAMVNIN